jgi:hypothetical protein
MTAKSTSGLQAHITKASVTPNSLTISAISSAAPPVCTVSDTSGMTTGDMVYLSSTGFTELDDKWFVTDVLSGTTFSLLGEDLTASTGSIDTPVCDHYDTGDVVLCCLSGLTMNVTEPGTISTGTYCDPTSSIPSSVVEAGTLTLTGFVDVAGSDYQELRNAVDDGESRAIRVTLPSNGYLYAPMILSSMTWDLPLDGAIGYSASATLGTKLKHAF